MGRASGLDKNESRRSYSEALARQTESRQRTAPDYEATAKIVVPSLGTDVRGLRAGNQAVVNGCCSAASDATRNCGLPNSCSSSMGAPPRCRSLEIEDYEGPAWQERVSAARTVCIPAVTRLPFCYWPHVLETL